MKTAVVTGGAGDIGSAIVKKLCSLGYSTAILYKNSEERANALSSLLALSGFDAFAVPCDVTSSQSVNQAVQTVLRRNGRLDVLVNNAGLAGLQLFDTVTDEQWYKMLDTNLSGVFFTCRAVAGHLIKQQSGKIINISSMWGQVGASMEVCYSAAKAGVIGLTKALAKELAPSGITVNCIAPGAVDTKMMAGFSQQEKAELCREIPLGRLGTPREIAQAVGFLVSDDALYITGQVLGVNGGMVI